MDSNDKINLLRELLSDKDVKETLKKILLEDEPPKTIKKKAVAKKTPVKKKTVSKNKEVSEETNSFKTNKKILDKNSKEYGRRSFKDDLSEAIEEEIDGFAETRERSERQIRQALHGAFDAPPGRPGQGQVAVARRQGAHPV